MLFIKYAKNVVLNTTLVVKEIQNAQHSRYKLLLR